MLLWFKLKVLVNLEGDSKQTLKHQKRDQALYFHDLREVIKGSEETNRHC